MGRECRRLDASRCTASDKCFYMQDLEVHRFGQMLLHARFEVARPSRQPLRGRRVEDSQGRAGSGDGGVEVGGPLAPGVGTEEAFSTST